MLPPSSLSAPPPVDATSLAPSASFRSREEQLRLRLRARLPSDRLSAPGLCEDWRDTAGLSGSTSGITMATEAASLQMLTRETAVASQISTSALTLGAAASGLAEAEPGKSISWTAGVVVVVVQAGVCRRTSLLTLIFPDRMCCPRRLRVKLEFLSLSAEKLAAALGKASLVVRMSTFGEASQVGVGSPPGLEQGRTATLSPQTTTLEDEVTVWTSSRKRVSFLHLAPCRPSSLAPPRHRLRGLCGVVGEAAAAPAESPASKAVESASWCSPVSVLWSLASLEKKEEKKS